MTNSIEISFVLCTNWYREIAQVLFAITGDISAIYSIKRLI